MFWCFRRFIDRMQRPMPNPIRLTIAAVTVRVRAIPIPASCRTPLQAPRTIPPMRARERRTTRPTTPLIESAAADGFTLRRFRLAEPQAAGPGGDQQSVDSLDGSVGTAQDYQAQQAAQEFGSAGIVQGAFGDYRSADGTLCAGDLGSTNVACLDAAADGQSGAASSDGPIRDTPDDARPCRQRLRRVFPGFSHPLDSAAVGHR